MNNRSATTRPAWQRWLAWRQARTILAVAAVLFTAAFISVHFWQTGTSVTVVQTTVPASVKTTTVHSAGSGSFQLGLLGFAAVFALAAIFYGRLSSITLPGGIGIKLTPEQKQQASQALARQTLARAAQPGAQPGAPAQFGATEPPRQPPHVLRLAAMAKTDGAADPGEVNEVASATVAQSATASQHTTDLAETMLQLARTSPDALRVLAEQLRIPREQWSQVLTGMIPDEVWDTLAARALDQVT
jgi:hypothetical protein